MSSGRLTCSCSTCEKIRMQPDTVGPYFYYPKTVSQTNLSFCSPFSRLLRDMMNCIPKHIHLELNGDLLPLWEWSIYFHPPFLICQPRTYILLKADLFLESLLDRLYPLYLLYAVSCWLFPKTVTNVKNELYTNPCWLSPITHLCIH